MLIDKLKEDLSDIVKYSLLSITYLVVVVLLAFYVIPRRLIQSIYLVIPHKKRTENKSCAEKEHDSKLDLSV